MRSIGKLAKEFEQQAIGKENDPDVFGELSAHLEAKQLYHLAGKLLYKANKHSDVEKMDELKEASRLLLLASEILKRV